MITYTVKKGSTIRGHSYSEVSNKTTPFSVNIDKEMTFSNVDLQSIDTVQSGTFYIFYNVKEHTTYEVNYDDVKVNF